MVINHYARRQLGEILSGMCQAGLPPCRHCSGNGSIERMSRHFAGSFEPKGRKENMRLLPLRKEEAKVFPKVYII
jgi:hypothetical protein